MNTAPSLFSRRTTSTKHSPSLRVKLARIIQTQGESITHCSARNKPRSERANERKGAPTCMVLGYKLASSLDLRFTTWICRPPQGTDPLPATGEACYSVDVRRE